MPDPQTITQNLTSALTLTISAEALGLPAPFISRADEFSVEFGFHAVDDLAAWAVWLEAPMKSHESDVHPGKVFHDAVDERADHAVRLFCVETILTAVAS